MPCLNDVWTENGTPFKPYRRLAPEEYADAEQRILYEDNHLLVVNKRAGEIVQADKTEDETLTDFYGRMPNWRNWNTGFCAGPTDTGFWK